MDRIIKFRGKNKNIGWVYGQLAYDINGNAYIIQEVEIDASYGLEESILFATMWYRVDKETIGQFTGLYDKNGKVIYEGDIIYCKKYIDGNWIENCIEKGYIYFNKGEFGLYRKQGYYQSLYKFKEYDYEFEVIGNIYENKNLLEEE